MWHRAPLPELTAEEWKGVFRQLKKEGFLYLSFTGGGEPLLREDFRNCGVCPVFGFTGERHVQRDSLNGKRALELIRAE